MHNDNKLSEHDVSPTHLEQRRGYMMLKDMDCQVLATWKPPHSSTAIIRSERKAGIVGEHYPMPFIDPVAIAMTPSQAWSPI